MSTRSKS